MLNHIRWKYKVLIAKQDAVATQHNRKRFMSSMVSQRGMLNDYKASLHESVT